MLCLDKLAVCRGPTLTPHGETLRMITMQKKAEPRDGETSISSVYLIFDNLDPAMPEATPGIYNLSCDSD